MHKLNKILFLPKVALVSYLAICTFMWCGQRYIMYGFTQNIQSPEVYGLQGFETLRLQSADGTHIQAWYHKAANGFPTLVWLHGNGDNLAYERDVFSVLVQSGFGIMAPDYRGFGASEGTPTEKGLYQDARAAIIYAHGTFLVPYDKLVLYGESLGTGVAVQMATEFPVEAVVLQSPYSSVEAIAKMRYFWLPVHFLIKDRYDSISKIANVHAPLLLMHGERDIIVPVGEGRALFAKANNPKQAVYFPDYGHNDIDVGARVKAVLDFSRKYHLINDTK